MTSGYSISLIILQEGGDVKPLALSPSSLYSSWKGTRKNPCHCSKRVGDVVPNVMVYFTCVVIGLGGRGVIKTWTEVAAKVRLYKLTSDLTSLVPPQFSHWLQVRNVGTVYFLLFHYFFFNQSVIFMRCVDLSIQTVFPTAFLKLRCQKRRCYMLT